MFAPTGVRRDECSAVCCFFPVTLYAPRSTFLVVIPGVAHHVTQRGNRRADAVAVLRRQTATGRRCGSKQFIEQLEARLGRILRPQKAGRKPKRQHREEPKLWE